MFYYLINNTNERKKKRKQQPTDEMIETASSNRLKTKRNGVIYMQTNLSPFSISFKH